MRFQFLNVVNQPVINDEMQKAGRQFEASEVTYIPGSLNGRCRPARR